MANVNDVYAGNWLSADDLQGSNGQYQDAHVIVERVDVQTFEDREKHQTETKLALFFQGKKKGMVLNKTNARMLSWAFGPETDYWVGKNITIGVEIVAFGNRMVPGLRVRQLTQQLPQMPQQPNSGGMVPVPNAADPSNPNYTGDPMDPADDVPF